MVCAKCQRLKKKTELATPGVQRKSDLYLGSPNASTERGKSSATLKASGIGKSKLLIKGALNPYSAYSSTCATCKTRIDQGHKFCNQCAYKSGSVCTICGKIQNKSAASSGVQGQKYSSNES
ncbi:microtubule-associated protein CRIPT-domain-containing protein [Usnea florida]